MNERIRVRGAIGRCAYCHDEVAVEERAACASCLAVHHGGCWDEHGACAACAGSRVLVAPAGAEPVGGDMPSRAATEAAGFTRSLADAARELSLSPQQLIALVNEERLRARFDGEQLRFRPEDLERLWAVPQPRSEPEDPAGGRLRWEPGLRRGPHGNRAWGRSAVVLLVGILVAGALGGLASVAQALAVALGAALVVFGLVARARSR